MSQDDLIPEKWYIVPTEETEAEIAMWFDLNFTYPYIPTFYGDSINNIMKYCYTNALGRGKAFSNTTAINVLNIPQITIDVLRLINKKNMTKEDKLVLLGRNVKNLKLEIGDYFKVIKNTTSLSDLKYGKIYKVGEVVDGYIYAHNFFSNKVIKNGSIRFDHVKKLSEDELRTFLLNKANKDYPIDTFYYSPEKNNLEIVKGKFRFYIDLTDGIEITDGNGGYVFYKGKWAKKLELPKIGCLIGKTTKTSITYGGKILSKSALLEMKKAEIHSITLTYGFDEYIIYGEDLQKIYKVCEL
jgi:hypothetical protein